MNLAAIVALCGLAFTVVLQIGVFAYFIGRLTQRVKTLEDDGSGHNGLALQFAHFEGKVTEQLKNQSASIEGLRGDFHRAFTPKGGA